MMRCCKAVAGALVALSVVGLTLSGTTRAAKPNAKKPKAVKAAAAKPTAAGREFFEKKIRPVLAKHCYECHSAKSKKVKGKLLLDTREGTRAGGESGHAVVPGNLDDSLIVEALRHDGLEMPEEKLPDQVIADFEKWIKMGAPDPRDGKFLVKKDIDFEKARQFWSFRPLKKPMPPTVRDKAWPRSDMDRFVLARLEAKQLHPVDDAQRRVLLRRVYFDLIGLPPSPSEVDAFLADRSSDALAKVVDRLLDSPQFGERWGRHWLDVVRYAESSGMERNYTYPQAWRYRDYVIASLNADKPYDQFVREQIAGDLMPARDAAHRDELTIATGMLAMGPKSLNARNKEKFRMDVVDEQIDVTTRAFMGLTVACARCHDHKFDPIPSTEYYALAGIFRSTTTLYGTGAGRGNRQNGRLVSLSGGDDPKLAAKRDAHQKKVAALTKQLTAARKAIKRLVKKGSSAKNAKKKNAKNKRRKKGAGRNKKNPGNVVEARALVKKLQAELRELGKSAPPPAAQAMAVREAPKAADCRVHLRGEVGQYGPSVPRGFATIATVGDAPAISETASGRLQLAEWITKPGNPLTARVMVNRMWQHLFGRGINSSVNNFGALGSRPTHPQLLDWLAAQFVEDGWSTKKMLRRIVLSRTYQLSGDSDAKCEQVDPANELFWRMSQRRLDAEAMRDAMLAASGILDRTPPVGSVVARVGNGDIGRGIAAGRFASDETHRSVYLPIVRGVVPEMLQVFDFPEPSNMAAARDVTTVPTQALFMLNSPFVIQQSRYMAGRLLAEKNMGVDGRIKMAYRLALSRDATASELDRGATFVEETSQALAKGNEVGAWAALCQVLLASAEFRYID